MADPTTNPKNPFERSGALRPGDVVLSFAGPAPAKILLGTWLQTVAHDARQRVGTTPVFVIGLESSVMGASSVSQAVAEIRQAVGDRMAEPVIIELTTEEAETGLANFPFQQEHAIIALLDVERLRFSGLRSTGPLTKNIDGTYIRVSEAEDLSLSHVERLCAAICQAAPNAGQKWLIISRGYGFGSTVPATLVPLGNLDIQQLQEESHDPALASEFRKLLANVQTAGPNPAFKWVAERLPAGKIAAIARANIFSLTGQPIQAYKTISGVAEQIIANGFSEEIIQLVQLAVAAGQRPAAAEWVRHLPAPRTLQLENLRAAHLLAKQLDNDQLWSTCVAEFRRRFPHDPLTELDQFNELLEAKDYLGAAAQAEITGKPFRRAVALFLSDPAQSPAPLLSTAEAADELPQALWTLAKSAKQRKDYGACRDFAHRLADDEEYAARAAALRVRALREQIPGISEDDLHRELADLLEWCARHPAELNPRFDLEALFDSVSTAGKCIAHTLALLTTEIGRLAKAFDLSKIPLQCALETDLPLRKDNRAFEFAKAVVESGDDRGVAIGTGRLSPAQAALVDPRLWADFGHTLEWLADQRNADGTIDLLHAIMAMARETHDPASDLLAARQVVSLQSGSQNPQQALDLAESLLVLLPSNHTDHKNWRQSIAWLTYADVSLRLGNVLAALRFLYFACALLRDPPQHAHLFLEMFRTAARVARDLKIPPIAGHFLAIERQLLRSFPDLQAKRERQLRQMDLGLGLLSWRPAAGTDVLLTISRTGIELLDQSELGEEVVPLLSVAAQAAQFYQQAAGPLPTDILENLRKYAKKAPAGMQATIGVLLDDKITVNVLRHLATRTIRSSADWSLALTPAIVAARKALAQACAERSAELFWTACLILCQPGLGVRLTEMESDDPYADPVAAAKWLAQQLESGTTLPLDAVLVQRAMSNSSSAAAGELLFQISLEEFLNLIAEDETVILLATDNTNTLFRCELRRGAASRPYPVGKPEWDYRRFLLWSRAYPAKYGDDLEIWFGNLCKPPAADIAPTLAGLSPAGSPTSKAVTVIAEGRLFGFAHRLAVDLAGSASSVTVCPSARWLGTTRRLPAPIKSPIQAWLGLPQTENRVLKELRAGLLPLFAKASVVLSDSETLPRLRSQTFVILGSHGQAGNAAGFTRLNDGEKVYEPDRVAASLAGTACVVLFVCHGGRGDEGLYSHETTGLTSSLLRHGVRTVVAPLWPLDVTLAVAWFGEFIKTNPDHPIAVRVDEAQRAMAKSPSLSAICGEHPLVRSTFTVFGDGNLGLHT